MKRLVWFLIFIFSYTFGSGEKKHEVQNQSAYKSALYDICLKYGSLDAKAIRSHFFEGNSPEQINLALNDVRKFLERDSSGRLSHDLGSVDEVYLIQILNIYGWLIRYIEQAYVMPDNRVFKFKEREVALLQGAIPLFAYWGKMERENGVRLHWYKFYATVIDHLIIFIRSRLLFPCNNPDRLHSRPWWMSWLTDRLQRPLVGNLKYGQYYYKNVKLFEELYETWVDEFRERVSGEQDVIDLESMS